MVSTLKQINPLCPWERFALEFYSCHSSNTKRTKAASFTTAAWCVSSQCGLMYCGRCLKKEKKIAFHLNHLPCFLPSPCQLSHRTFPTGGCRNQSSESAPSSLICQTQTRQNSTQSEILPFLLVFVPKEIVSSDFWSYAHWHANRNQYFLDLL